MMLFNPIDRRYVITEFLRKVFKFFLEIILYNLFYKKIFCNLIEFPFKFRFKSQMVLSWRYICYYETWDIFSNFHNHTFANYLLLAFNLPTPFSRLPIPFSYIKNSALAFDKSYDILLQIKNSEINLAFVICPFKTLLNYAVLPLNA